MIPVFSMSPIPMHSPNEWFCRRTPDFGAVCNLTNFRSMPARAPRKAIAAAGEWLNRQRESDSTNRAHTAFWRYALCFSLESYKKRLIMGGSPPALSSGLLPETLLRSLCPVAEEWFPANVIMQRYSSICWKYHRFASRRLRT